MALSKYFFLTINLMCVLRDISVELDAFMAVLDQRLIKKQQQQPVGLVAKKVRKVGKSSETNPPHGAPIWAVKKEFHNGMDCNISQCSIF